MYRPLESNKKSNEFNIGEILDNPSVFGNKALANDDSNSIGPRPMKRLNAEDNKEDRRNKRFSLGNKDESSKSTFSIKSTTTIKQKDVAKQDTTKKPSLESYAQKSITRFNQSSYDIMEIIKKKKELHNNARIRNSSTTSTGTSNQLANQSKSTAPKTATKANKSNSIKSNATKTNPSKMNSFPKYQEANEVRQDFLHSILNWRTQWFKNANNNEPPKLCEEKVQQLKLSYTSVDEYIQFYKPLMLNEIWSQIVERVDAIKKSKPCKIQLFIHTYEVEDSFLVLNCVLPVTNDDFNKNIYPNEGDLIVAEISVLNEQSDGLLTLGYIAEFAIDEINEKTTLNKNIVYPSTCKKLLRYIIKLKLMNVKINVEKPLRCSAVYYLKPKLRQCEALTNLDKSALHQGIINPEKQLVSIKEASFNSKDAANDSDKFNNSQLNVISNATNLVSNGAQPGILLVQGPPGNNNFLFINYLTFNLLTT